MSPIKLYRNRSLFLAILTTPTEAGVYIDGVYATGIDLAVEANAAIAAEYALPPSLLS